MAVLVFFLALSVGATEGESLYAEELFRKTRMRLMGVDPSHNDYLFFRSQVSHCEEREASLPNDPCINAPLRRAIREAFQTNAFLEKIVDRVHNLLYMRSEWVSPSQRPSLNNIYGRELTNPEGQDTLTNLIIDIFSNNLSWDHFFTAGTFTGTSSGSNAFLYGDAEQSYFVHHISPDQKPVVPSEDKLFSVEVEDPDLAAGFIITPSFNERFPNNTVNRGRGRAEAVIRAGLCDMMFPSADLNAQHEQLESLIAQGLGPADGSAVAAGREALHGTQPSCQACHIYRGLDPLAQTFLATELVIGLEPFPSRFTYRNPEGELFDIPVRGIGHWTRTLVTRPEYEECQVKNFWDFFVGDPKILDDDPALMAEVVDAFNERDRKSLDFIEYLFFTEEFRQRESSLSRNASLYSEVRPSLEHCTNCHRNQEGIPSFSNPPFMQSGEDRTAHYAVRILERLRDGTMPPPSYGWRPSEEDIGRISAWIEGGLPDGEGNRHLSEEWSQGVFGDERSGSLAYREPILFEGTHRRFLAPFDLFRFLQHKFRVSGLPSSNICTLGDTSYISTGGFVPEKEGRLINTPGQSFIRWYSSCIEAMVERKMGMKDIDASFVGEPLIEWASLRDEPPTGSAFRDRYKWNDLPRPLQLETVRRLVHRLVGPDFVQEDLHYTGPSSNLRGTPRDEEELIDTIMEIPGLSSEHNSSVTRGFTLVSLYLLLKPNILIH